MTLKVSLLKEYQSGQVLMHVLRDEKTGSTLFGSPS